MIEVVALFVTVYILSGVFVTRRISRNITDHGGRIANLEAVSHRRPYAEVKAEGQYK